VPEGVAGELWLGGPSVARGYLGQPALTAERFVPSPIPGDYGARRYRSGDIVVRRDGELVLLGRGDAQLNLNGNRLEPGEVEVRLRAQAGVSDARVVVESQTGRGQLVAYLLCPDPVVVNFAELRQRLDRELPAPLRPTRYRTLPRWPLLGTGKLDLHALASASQEVDTSSSPVSTAATSPRVRERELILTKIWKTVLQLENLELDENFFALGGDSILSLQIVAGARRAGITLTPRDLFDHPTIAALARLNEPLPGENSVPNLDAPPGVAAQSADMRLTPIQCWFFGLELARRTHFNQSRLLAVPPNLNAERLRSALIAVVEHHDALRSGFSQIEGTWSARLLSMEEWSRVHADRVLQHVELGREPLAGQSAQIEAASALFQTTLDLNGGLFRALYFDRGPEHSGRLFLVAHHLVVDAVSWRILLEDLGALLSQDVLRSDLLPPTSLSYARWASALRDAAESSWVDGERAHWHAIPNSAPLPRDLDGRNLQRSLAGHTVQLAAESTLGLQHLAVRQSVSLDAVLLTALAQALSPNVTGSTLVVDYEAHGREAVTPGLDVSRTVGWFTSRFPVPLTIGKEELADPAKAWLALQAELDSSAHKGISYGLLRYLRADDSLRAQPRPEVSYNYLGQIDRGLSAGYWTQHAEAISESTGSQRDPAHERSELIALQAYIRGGQLTLTWLYSSAVHRAETIAQWAGTMVRNLETWAIGDSSDARAAKGTGGAS
jgi:non-ribosomal peptide synthase protein (TIGR01720 family)